MLMEVLGLISELAVTGLTTLPGQRLLGMVGLAPVGEAPVGLTYLVLQQEETAVMV